MRVTRREFAASCLLGLQPWRGKPNLVLVLSDQQHWRAAGFMDDFFETPALDRLASQAAVFENSFCSTPQCSPSRSSIFTGYYPSHTGVRGNIGMTGGKPLPMPTFAPVLQRAGYTTAYYGKWHLGGDVRGNAGWEEEYKEQDDAETTRRSVEFLRRRREASKPFALVASYLNPHDVYQYKPGERKPDPRTPLPASLRPNALGGKPRQQSEFMQHDQGRRILGQPSDEYRAYRELYREKVRLFDEHLGKMLAGLDAQGLASNTVVVVTSDHGDMDAHHGLIWKGPFMYEQMIRVPLLARGPGIAPRRVRDHHAVNVDIAPTLLDFAGAIVPVCHGVSLKPLLTGHGRFQRREVVYAQYHGKQQWTEPIRMVRTAEWKYSLYRNGGEELYNLRGDPGERHNLASSVAHRTRKALLRALLEKWIKDNNDEFFLRQA